MEDKIREFIAPTDEALIPEIDRSIYSQFAEKCIQAITDCIPLDEMVADRIFESIFENRDVDRAVALFSSTIPLFRSLIFPFNPLFLSHKTFNDTDYLLFWPDFRITIYCHSFLHYGNRRKN